MNQQQLLAPPQFNMDALRRPLAIGWRRQTCVRGITAGGVRGDVIYLTPDNTRLANWQDTQKVCAYFSPPNYPTLVPPRSQHPHTVT